MMNQTNSTSQAFDDLASAANAVGTPPDINMTREYYTKSCNVINVLEDVYYKFGDLASADFHERNPRQFAPGARQRLIQASQLIISASQASDFEHAVNEITIANIQLMREIWYRSTEDLKEWCEEFTGIAVYFFLAQQKGTGKRDYRPLLNELTKLLEETENKDAGFVAKTAASHLKPIVQCYISLGGRDFSAKHRAYYNKISATIAGAMIVLAVILITTTLRFFS